MTTIGKIESFDDTKENWETYVERVEQFFLANDIDNDRPLSANLVELDRRENLHSAEGSSCTGEASYKVLSTDIYHSPGAFEPKAPWKLRKDFVFTRETKMKEKVFCLTWPS